MLFAAETLVSGVLAALPIIDPVGVEADVPVSFCCLADCFAAFSASRFCFDAEGGISGKRRMMIDVVLS